MSEGIITALIAGLCVAVPNIIATIYTKNLITYRVDQLEIKQDKHNKVIERVFALEGRMNEAEHDIRDLKGKVN